ncbi:MAG TPA: methyltransferase domain-containing protein [Ilumatobacteraceae bacterium]|nr:methyltransferase domain-containing protein [Ilumatobacteraceae bacterium]
MTATTTDQVRAHVHGMWAAVAGPWGEHADEVDERGAEMTSAMLAAVDLQPGEHVLELACGTGGVGIAAAERVGGTGQVVLSDVVPQMVALAAERAGQRGLSNVRAATLDLEQIAEPDCAFDAVLCREGLMFAVQPERAAGEIHRVLRPRGRVAIAVWGPQHDNPWLGLVFEAVTSITGFPVPPPGIPGPFALGDVSRLRQILVDAGLVDVSIEELPTPLRSPSFEAWWQRTRAVAGPLTAMLARLDDRTTADIEEHLRRAAAPYTSDAGVDLPGLTLLASARRPG